MINEIKKRFLHRSVDQYQCWCSTLSKRLIKWGVQDADCIYNMYCENLDFLKYVKQNHPKIKILIDVYINPQTNAILEKAQKETDLKIAFEITAIQSLPEKVIRETFELADILICPSRFVADGVCDICPKFSSKIRIVPYGSSISYMTSNSPIRGRFFFAGTDWFRKGLQYFAQAATTLKSKYPDMDFRVAGVTAPHVLNMPLFKDLTFLGKLNKEEMQQEFLNADAFVLPSLSEGMAGVVLEAIASGCPVVITEACGIDCIQDGVNGFIVDPNADSVAKKLQTIYVKREIRESVANKTTELISQFSLDSWKTRLLNVIAEFDAE